MGYVGVKPSAVPLTSADITDGIIVNADIASGAAIATSKLGTGAVLQVVSTHKNDDFTTASASFVDVTGLSASITPSSASNKILVMFSITVSNNNAGTGTHIRLMRDSTEIAPARSVANYESSWHTFSNADTNITRHVSFQFLDSPSTTSATTYKLQVKPQANTTTVNRSGSDTASQAYSHKSSSTITVMEIAG